MYARRDERRRQNGFYVEFSYKTTVQGKKEGDMLYSKRSLLHFFFFDNITAHRHPSTCLCPLLELIAKYNHGFTWQCACVCLGTSPELVLMGEGGRRISKLTSSSYRRRAAPLERRFVSSKHETNSSIQPLPLPRLL